MSFAGIYGQEGFLFDLNSSGDKQEMEKIWQQIHNANLLEEASASGFIIEGEQTYMFALKQISTTDAATTAPYYFIFLRDYYDFTNEKLGKIAGAGLMILDYKSLSPQEQQHLQRLKEKNNKNPDKIESALATFYEFSEDETISSYHYLMDINQNIIGVLCSKTDTKIITQGKKSIQQTGLILLSFGLTIAGISALFIGRVILKPLNLLEHRLHSLLDTGEVLDRDDSYRIMARSDEIGDLYKSFIDVRKQIQVANEKNQQFNEQLETLVEERTKALKIANDELILLGKSFEETSEGLVITDSKGRIIMSNNSYGLLCGYDNKELIGQIPKFFKPGNPDRNLHTDLEEALINFGNWEGEIDSLKKNGQMVPIWLTVDEIRDKAGMITHYVGALSDMTMKKEMEKQLEKMAFYDDLTGLANRSLFYIHLKKALARSVSYGYLVAVIFIDLDGFKLVNDTFGHSQGDFLLIEVGRRIQSRIRESDFLSRWGGDEFSLVLENIKDKADIIPIANDLLSGIAEEITISGEHISIGASIGIALFPEDGETMEQIMSEADSAMYASKKSGKNCYTFAMSALEKGDVPKIIRINRLKKAIENLEFDLVYQPQIMVAANESTIFGAEALIRWTDSEGKIHMPDEFISLAEESGIIQDIGKWVIEEACRSIREMSERGIKIPISVNVSVVQFQTNDLINTVKEAIVKNQINPQLLYIEMTENVFAEDELQVALSVQALKELGIKIVLDDFGKGYSSLGLISQLPFDIIKVDKSFTQNIELEKEKKLAIMIISIGTILNIQTIIEGVETEEQVDFLIRNGGSIFQGFFFSKPLDKTDFLDLCLEKRRL